MKHKRIKLLHSYHDGMIRAVEYSNAEDIALEVELCGCSDSPGARVHLTFTGVRNFDDVRRALEEARATNPNREYIAEIAGILRHEKRGYLLDLGASPGVQIDAKGLLET